MTDPVVKNLIPTTGLRGIYTVRAPFNTLLMAGVAYTCISVRGVAELINSGVDPFTKYYAPNNITQTQFSLDTAAGMTIVTLQAAQGVWVDIPSTYIESMPDLNGVPYTPLVAAIRLGAVPDAMDLTVVKQRMSAVVLEELGIVAAVEVVQIGLQELVAQDVHTAAQASRDAQKADADTDYAKYLEQKALAESLAQRLAALEQVLIAQG